MIVLKIISVGVAMVIIGAVIGISLIKKSDRRIRRHRWHEK